MVPPIPRAVDDVAHGQSATRHQFGDQARLPISLTIREWLVPSQSRTESGHGPHIPFSNWS